MRTSPGVARRGLRFPSAAPTAQGREWLGFISSFSFSPNMDEQAPLNDNEPRSSHREGKVDSGDAFQTAGAAGGQ